MSPLMANMDTFIINYSTLNPYPATNFICRLPNADSVALDQPTPSTQSGRKVTLSANQYTKVTDVSADRVALRSASTDAQPDLGPIAAQADPGLHCPHIDYCLAV